MRASRAEKKATGRWVFHLTAGRLCLDLANTVSWRRSGRPIERLEAYGNLIEWARQSGVLTEGEARLVEREARRRPAAAARMLTRTRALREAIYRIFGGLARGAEPDPADLSLVDRELHDAMRQLRLAWTRSGPALAYRAGAGQLARPLWSAARSAADLLATGSARRLRTCPSSDCGWVFLDETKSGTRRWCDMRVCGSRAKARRYYRRRRRERRAPHTTRTS